MHSYEALAYENSELIDKLNYFSNENARINIIINEANEKLNQITEILNLTIK